jgi:hypothetical protein
MTPHIDAGDIFVAMFVVFCALLATIICLCLEVEGLEKQIKKLKEKKLSPCGGDQVIEKFCPQCGYRASRGNPKCSKCIQRFSQTGIGRTFGNENKTFCLSNTNTSFGFAGSNSYSGSLDDYWPNRPAPDNRPFIFKLLGIGR